MYKVSICIPTYNGAQYLEACLDSVLNQTYKNIEILVVDDGSTDATLAILERYAASDQRIRLVRNEHNLGLVGNWNRCIEQAQGEWIKFLFQDDLLDSKCLEAMLAAADRAILISCRREFVFESGIDSETRHFFSTVPTLDSVFGGKTQIDPQTLCKAVLEHFGTNFIGEPTSVMLHRSVFQRFGKFNADLVQLCDFEYWIRVGVHTGLTYVPETLAKFRVHSGSASSANAKQGFFRKSIADKLIMRHEFAYNKVFSPLIAVAEGSRGASRKAEFVKYALEVRLRVEQASSHPEHPNPKILQEWEQLALRYPKIRVPFQRLKLSIKNQLERHIFWRFKR